MARKEEKYQVKTEEKEKQAYGNESFGIPSDYTKKQKFSGLKLAFYIVVVVSVCGLIYTGFHRVTDTFLPEMTFDKSKDPLLYIKNKEVTIKDYNDRKGREIVSSERMYSGGDGRYVTLTKNEKYVFFARENTSTASGFDLCYRAVSEIDGIPKDQPEETVQIDFDVRSYLTSSVGNFVVYQKGNRLYFSNLTEKVIVATDVSEYYLSENGQQIIYYKTDGRVYTRGTSLDSMPALVDFGISKMVSPKQEYAKMYYICDNNLYRKDHGVESILLAEDVIDAIMLGEELYFVRREPCAWQFSEIFLDDVQASDKEMKEPYLKDYYKKDAQGNRYLDETAYNEDAKVYERKQVRDKVRSHLAEFPIVTEQFVLYTVERDQIRVVDKNLAEYTLRYNSCKDVVVYKRNVLEEEKISFSTVTGIEDAIFRGTEYAETPVTVGMAVLKAGAKPYLGLTRFPEGQIEISLDGKYLYYMEQESADDKGTLVRYEFFARELKNRTELKKEITDFALDGADSKVVMVFDGNRIGILQDRTYTHLSDSSNHDFFYVDGTLYFFDGYNEEVQAGILKRFRDGKIRAVDTNVHAFDVRNLKTVTYIKNYSTEFGFGDLYTKTGDRKRVKVDICVRSILH